MDEVDVRVWLPHFQGANFAANVVFESRQHLQSEAVKYILDPKGWMTDLAASKWRFLLSEQLRWIDHCGHFLLPFRNEPWDTIGRMR